MAVRGEGSGLADRVGKVEEDIRNLRRLPGAVVPPPLVQPAAAPVVVTGGMAEEMYARYTALAATSGDGSTGQLELTASDGYGSGIPVLNATGGVGFPDDEIAPQVSGYHLLSVEALVLDSIDAAEIVVVKVSGGPLSNQTIRVPYRVLDDGALGLPQRLTAALHLLGADDPNAGTLQVEVVTVNSLGDHTLAVAVGLSRIGVNVAGGPFWHTEV